MKTSSFFIIVLLLVISNVVFAQVGISTDNSAADPSAMLDVKSTTKGALVPRMTQAQIGIISSPVNGLIVFCTTDNKFYAYMAATNTWKELLYGSGTILPSCNFSFTINHVIGTVAPVNKQVTYKTVTNIPGEPTKCWITSNLGADHQATAVDDVTEASAGWYWQFNRKQGYKNDGTTLTPSWTITSINETSDWIASNDPCTIELGAGWRIPTSTEWTNVDAGGNWIDWNGPWSALKMHAAGSLHTNDGSLFNQGWTGIYWSSKMIYTDEGWGFVFRSDICQYGYYMKAYGHSLRCIKNN